MGDTFLVYMMGVSGCEIIGQNDLLCQISGQNDLFARPRATRDRGNEGANEHDNNLSVSVGDQF